MTEILVSGYYGFFNAGDEAILGGIIASVRQLDPSVRFTVISGKAARTREVHGVEAISRGDYQSIWRAVARTDLLLSGGGSLLQDVTGVKSIPYYLGVVTMAKLRGLPVMFYAQGVGPVTGVVGRSLIPAVGNFVNQITVRDAESAQVLRALGVRRPALEVTADAALALGPADPLEARSLLADVGVSAGTQPIIGVAIRPWRFATEQMLSALAQSLDQIAAQTGAAILFIPMQQNQDPLAAQSVAARMQQPAVVMAGDFTYRQIQALIGSCDALIGMRYHALVFAAMAGVPLVGLSYDPKNDSFLRLLGQEAVGRPEHLSAERLTTALLDALQRAPAIRAHYADVIARLTPLSRRNAALAVDLMNRWRGL
jgi:polysaccharide pyruvyl transferase CsaB